jgi:hypothetical protein
LTIRTTATQSPRPGRNLTRQEAQKKIVKRFGKAIAKLGRPDDA